MPTLDDLDAMVASYETKRERERRAYETLRALGIEGSAAQAIVKGRKPWPFGDGARRLREDMEAAHLPPIVNRKLRRDWPLDLTPWVDRPRTMRALRGFGRWKR